MSEKIIGAVVLAILVMAFLGALDAFGVDVKPVIELLGGEVNSDNS